MQEGFWILCRISIVQGTYTHKGVECCMKLGFDLNLEQKQQLVITPELRKAIQLLQLSSLELNTYIEQEVIENPMLEISSTGDEDSGSQEQDSTVENTSSQNNQESDVKDSSESTQTEEQFDIDWQRYFEDSSDIGKLSNFVVGGRDEEDKDSFETFTSSTTNLLEQLYFQLSLTSADQEHLKPLAEFLVGNLDSNGYLRGSLEEISRFVEADEQDLEKALDLIQSLDPPGIGARDLRECLQLQLDRFEDSPELASELVQNYLSEIAENRLDRIARQLKRPIEDIQHAVDHIKSLTPKPASPFSIHGSPSYITPDIIVTKVEGDYEIIFNDNSTPKLKINSKYRQLLATEQKHSGVVKFLNSRLDSALWLIKSIEQRRITLQNIMETLIEFQRPFLDHGVSNLRPLTLKEVADEIDVHESTVSRATANKYVQTPQGIYPLRFFFSSKLEKGQNECNSSTSIKHKIKELVDQEHKQQPLSDQAIVDSLRDIDIDISRRTVAKYRKECNIPSSSKRKRYS